MSKKTVKVTEMLEFANVLLAHKDNSIEFKEGVKDYKLWQDRIIKNKPNITRDEYMSLLNRIYAQSSSYVSYVKLIVRQNKVVFN